MSQVYRPNRKATDEDILRLNSVGLSLATIGDLLGCHPTTITARLRQLGVPPADTRRSFMEDVLVGMETEQQDWLADQVANKPVKDFVRELIVEKFHSTNQPNKQVEDVPESDE